MNMTDSIVLTGVGITRFGKQPGETVASLAVSAATAAITDSGVSSTDIDLVVFANSTQGAMDGQHGIRGQLALAGIELGIVPIINVENACCSATTALQVATAYVRAGMARHALIVGSEVMTQASPDAILAAFEGSWDVANRDQNIARLTDWGSGTTAPADAVELSSRTVFMDIYAAFARDHMTRFGSTAEQFAAVSAKNHMHSVHNPNAQFQRPFTVEEVLASKQVVWPLTVPMCSPISDGAAAAVVSTLADAATPRRAVVIRSIAIGHGGAWNGRDLQDHVSHRTAIRAYKEAGLAPADVDVAEVHDATAVGEVQQIEHMGLVSYGDGGAAAQRGDTAVGGPMPVNPSGGLESRGHPIGATGLAQIHELVTQLRGDAGARQVDGARIALAENSGGLVGVEEAAVAVTLLQAPST
jgi:acetyl-CoA acetyltransferase